MALNGAARLILSEATKKGTKSAFKEYAGKVKNANEEAAKVLKSKKK